MSEENYHEILKQLEEKASLKQEIYRNTLEVFNTIKSKLFKLGAKMKKDYELKDPSVEILYKENNQFEVQLKFSGDMLVLSMHSNVFTFEPSHSLYRTEYIKADNSRSYFGIIYIHNFLADSIKYNRLSDMGYLIARIFVNKEGHFMVEGEGQLGFLYEDFSNDIICEEVLDNILERSIIYCLDSDLLLRPFAQEKEISLHQKQSMLANSGYPTGKHIGYLFKSEIEQQNNTNP